MRMLGLREQTSAFRDYGTRIDAEESPASIY